jgi:hypothetical protein
VPKIRPPRQKKGLAVWTPITKQIAVCRQPRALDSVIYEDQSQAILEYTENVIQASRLSKWRSPCRNYVYISGSCGIELPLYGGNAALVYPAGLCMQYDQLSMLMDVYLNNGKMLVPVSYVYVLRLCAGTRTD